MTDIQKQKLAEIDRKIAKVAILSTPGPLLVGMGLLAKYGASDALPFPFVINATVVNVMLVVGAVILVWTGHAVFKLAMEKVKAESASGS